MVARTPETAKKDSKKMIRTFYLYLVTGITIVMILIGSVMLVNTALQTYVFNVGGYDVFPYYECDQPKFVGEKQIERTEVEKSECNKNAEERSKNQTSNERRRSVSYAISMLLIALPLYLYHWRVIQKENK